MRPPQPRRQRSSGRAALLALVSIPVLAIIHGIVLAKLWEWFVADTFGVMEVSVAQAIGLSTLAAFVTYQPDAKSKDYDEEYAGVSQVVRYITFGATRSLVTLGVGAIVKGFAG